MKSIWKPGVGCAVLAAVLCCPAAGAKGPRYVDPAKVDQDFAFQGEYVGQVETDEGPKAIGVQVIALGHGRFRAVGYPGGLPGAGWDGGEKVIAEGKRQDGLVELHTDKAAGTIQDGTMTIDINNDAAVDGKLRRTERTSPTLGQKPPAGAIVLFDGSGTDQWVGGRMTDDGLLMPGTTSKRKFGSHKVHIEFRLPYQPEDRGQARGNSGIYLQGRYEVQMLDSFGLEGKQNECGAIYGVKAPDVNMCLPPLTWQTYDIQFTAARYDADGNVTAPPRMTVRHNGVLVHRDVTLPADRSTRGARVQPGPEPGPIYLQDHGCPVRYRNIWVVETD